MMLAALVPILLVAGVAAWAIGRRAPRAARAVVVCALAVDAVSAAITAASGNVGGAWIAEVDLAWIPRFGIRCHLAMDRLSLVLVLLTLLLGAVAVVASRSVRDRVGFFLFNLACTLAGIVGVFLAVDLFLFYFFWELMLVPMYLLIAVWGHAGRRRAAIRFFLFTQAGGLLMLVAIVGLAIANHGTTGEWTYDYLALLGSVSQRGPSIWLALGFFAAFAVKLPVVPLHTWLPDAHTEAPTAGSVILAGVLLKTGAYGLIRFAVPLFPVASREIAPVAMALGVVGILYGAVLAFAQSDLKRLVAYTSVSHMGFVLLGVYAGNAVALDGAVMQIVAHGIATGGLFLAVGALADRTGTRDLDRLGGLWSDAPRLGGVVALLAMASLGLPGLANFVAEFLVLAGTFRASAPIAVAATFGLVLSVTYALRMFQRAFHGPRPSEPGPFPDLDWREVVVFVSLVGVLVWLGLAPAPVLDAAPPVPAAFVVGGAP